MLRRVRVVFSGWVFDKHTKFKLELAMSPNDMKFKDGNPTQTPLLDWYFDFTHLRDLSLRVGQYKVPFNRQRVISSGNLQFVDRSILNAEFNLDRDLGFEFFSKNFLGSKIFQYRTGLFMAKGRGNYQLGDFGFLYLIRLDLTPLGKFKHYRESDLERSKTPKLGIGAAYGLFYNPHKDGGNRHDAVTDLAPLNTFTSDVIFKVVGFSFQGAFSLRDGPRNGLGFSAQAAYLLPWCNLEFGSRFTMIRRMLDKTTMEDQNTLGGVVSYYFVKHAFKLQVDYFWSWASEITNGHDQVRVQLQAGL
jgi:hypothetical protein